MSFASISFFFFFPAVTALHFLTPQRFRWLLLLIASCVFYMAFVPAYIFIMAWLIGVDYTVGILLERRQGRERHALLMISVISLVGVLFVFKYFNFFNANIAVLAALLGWKYSFAFLSLLLPLGLSFHTFQSLSYVIEVYRKKQPAEYHLGIYALYVLFFPQLVAGPIERPQHLLPQLHTKHDFEYERIANGLVRMGWGFLKKLVIADRLAVAVNHVYVHPSSFDGPALIIASIFFTLQLYFDFSGYCDIALGAAQVLGFSLMENFNRPFISTSVAEFWRRWHISLSSWFRDYCYLPMAFKIRRWHFGMYIAILVTFLLTGFWHGANWTYGVFGGLNGSYIIFGSLTQKYRDRFAASVGLANVPKVQRALRIATIFFLFAFTCIFFRAENVSDAWYILTHLLAGISRTISHSYLTVLTNEIGLSRGAILLVLALVVGAFLGEHIGDAKGVWIWIRAKPWYIRWPVYWAALFMLLMLNESTTSQFIYFQF